MVQRRLVSRTAASRPPSAGPAAPGTGRPLSAAVLSLQRSAGNRSVTRLFGAQRRAGGPGARRLARDVEADQLAEVAKAEASIKDAAVAAKTAAGTDRATKVKRLTADLLKLFAEETVAKVAHFEYAGKTTGFVVKDVAEVANDAVKQARGTIVAGDDVVTRAADGRVTELGQELRGAVAQIHAVDLAAGRKATIWIGSERVIVSSMAEKSDAERIVRDLQAKFGITLESTKLRAVARGVDKVRQASRQDELRGVDVTPWAFKELQALERALEHFAPLLGAARQRSARSKTVQEVSTVGKLTAGMDWINERRSTTKFGSFFPKDAAYAMYGTGTDAAQDFGTDNAKQLEGTAVHELAHGVFQPELKAFVRKIDFWDPAGVQSGKAGAEAPPTDRGQTSAEEDLAESVMLFFVDRQRLKDGVAGVKPGKPGNKCPKRDRFVEDAVKRWTK